MAFRVVKAPYFTHVILKEQVMGCLLGNTSPSTLSSVSIKHRILRRDEAAAEEKRHQFNQMGCYMVNVQHPVPGHHRTDAQQPGPVYKPCIEEPKHSYVTTDGGLGQAKNGVCPSGTSRLGRSWPGTMAFAIVRCHF